MGQTAYKKRILWYIFNKKSVWRERTKLTGTKGGPGRGADGMNLKQLEYVVEISRSGSINKAAQNLYLAQPSLSASVRQLEQELGFSIFRRKNSGIELTSEGKLMLLSAKLIMEEVDRIRRIPTLFDSQRNLSISGTWSSLLMCSFMQFRNDEPEEHIQDNFKETSFQQAVHDVMDQIYRLSIVSCLNSRLELHRLELQKHHICMEPLAVDVPAAAVFSKDHYLSRFKRVTLDQLKRCSVVTYDIRSNDDWLGAFGLESGEDVLNIFDRGGMLDAIRHNYVAVTTWDPELEASLPNTVMREITDGPLSSIYLLRHGAYTLNPREKRFLAYFQAQLDTVYGRTGESIR